MSTAGRLWALEPATYSSPADIERLGRRAPRIPFPVYLIEHDDGLVLFDGGLDPEFAGDPVAGYGEMARRIDIDFQPEHAVEAQLDILGFSAADVDTVVASHLHFDHAGSLKCFPHARTVIGAGELAYARAPERYCAAWFRREDFADENGIRWQEIEKDRDLFSDGAVTALYLPGHTPGSLALLVRLPTRVVVLSGDVVHTRAAFHSETAYHADVDTLTARESLRRLRDVLDTHQADLWIAHDPDDWARFSGDGPLG